METIKKLRDNETGEIIKFKWNADEEPTEKDLEQIVEAYRSKKPAKEEKAPGIADTVKKSISNIPSSALRYGKDMLSLAAHPMQTGTAIGQLFSGGAQAAMGDDTNNPDLTKFRGVVDFYKGRYGSTEGLRQTVEQDPVGLLSDLSLVVGGVGGATRAAGALSKAPGVARVGKAIQGIGTNIEPLSLVMKGAGQAAKMIPKGASRKMYSSAAKFSTVLSEGERSALVETALKHEVPTSISGVARVQEKIDVLNKKVSSVIDQASLNLYHGKGVHGMPIDDLFKDLDGLRKEVLANTGKPVSNLRAINSIEKQIRDANKALGRNELTPSQAQKLKQGIYRDLNGQYAEFKNSPVAKKTQKAIARSAKEYIESIIPEVKQLNAEEGALIDLKDALQRSASRISNRDILGIGAPIKAGAGGAAGGAPGAAAGLVIGLIDTPAVKSRLAVVVEKLRKNGIKIRPTSTAVRLGLVNIGRVESAEPKEFTTSVKSVGNITDRDLPGIFEEMRQR